MKNATQAWLIAAAIAQGMKEAFNGTPLPGLEKFDDCWTAEGHTLDITELVEKHVLPVLPHWKPMESAPKDASRVLVYGVHRGSPFITVAAYKTKREAGWYTINTGNRGLIKPTHWMPLPPAPANDNLEQVSA